MRPPLLIIAACWAAAAHAQTLPAGVDFAVSAHVLPDPCQVSLSGGGVADFGRLSLAEVRSWPLSGGPQAAYQSGAAGRTRTLRVNVSCLAPTKFALSVVDNRAGSLGATRSAADFGLGRHAVPGGAGAPIGAYRIAAGQLEIRPAQGSAARAPGSRLLATGDAAAGGWTRATAAEEVLLLPGRSLAFTSDPGSSAPDALLGVEGPLEISLELLQSTVDSAALAVQLDGSATLTFIGL